MGNCDILDSTDAGRECDRNEGAGAGGRGCGAGGVAEAWACGGLPEDMPCGAGAQGVCDGTASASHAVESVWSSGFKVSVSVFSCMREGE